jgi:hypothetical protein
VARATQQCDQNCRHAIVVQIQFHN